MKKQSKRYYLALCLSSVLIVAYAQSGPTSQPKVPDAWSNILRMNGYWEGPATLTLGNKTYQLDYHADFNITAEGNGLYMDEWFTDPELGHMKGANLIGYNPNDELIHWLSVDNMGTAHEHLGSWKTHDHFYMENQGMQDGKKYVEKIDCNFIGTNQLKIELVASLDGKVIEELKGNFKRKQKLVSK